MKDRSFFQKYGVIIALMITAGLMIFVKFKYSDYDWGEEIDNNVIVTPTLQPTPAAVLMQNMDYPLWQQLPYEGKGFVVDRYMNENTVVVIPKGLDRKIVEKEVWEWFEGNNVATEEMKIVWE